MRIALSIVFCTTIVASAADTSYGNAYFTSGERQIPLLELFTSEGCSSCPPADAWLSHLKDSARLWDDYVPVAFHVDYWNYIGWTDRFSKPDFTERQQQYIRDGAAGVAYTPGFFVAGNEWAGWFRGEGYQSSRNRVGELALTIDANSFAAHFSPVNAPTQKVSLSIAILGMNLSTQVSAGENHGKQLQHDFVVLNLQNVEMQSIGETFRAIGTLDARQSESSELAVAAWITIGKQQTPIQATGGYLH